jgi:hypothetical protein
MSVVRLQMPDRAAEAARLLELTNTGRGSAFDRHLNTLMQLLANTLGCSVLSQHVDGHKQHWALSGMDVGLRGFGRQSMHAFFVADADINDGNDGTAVTGASFRRWVESPIDLPFVLTSSPAAYTWACQCVGSHYALVWSPEEVVELVVAARPLEYLKTLLKKRFSIGMLHPFDHQKPVADARFRGRRELLQRLADNPRSSYAVVGPSKMGKTSLARRYLSGPTAKGVRTRSVYVDLFGRPVDDGALARAIRMAIDPGAAAYYDLAENLPAFLEKARSRLGGALEIVLDEVDKHVNLPLLRTLIHLAIGNVCRLILIGRWRLMKAAVHSREDNFSRLETIVLEPLSADEAWEILDRPLADLGLHTGPCRRELRHAIARLGRVPGIIQEFGSFLVQEARGEITSEVVKRALNRVVTTSRLIGLLNDLSCPLARAAALLLALYGPASGVVEPLSLQEDFGQRGIHARTQDFMELCDELVIHHLLGYDDGIYRMARWDIVAEGQLERTRFKAILEEELAELTRPNSRS